MVTAELVERSLHTTEIHSSNPVLGIFDLLSTVLNLYWKEENEEKRGSEWPNLKKFFCLEWPKLNKHTIKA